MSVTENAEAAFNTSGPRDKSVLSDANVNALWAAAKAITSEVAEQCWLVTFAIKAGWSAEWLTGAAPKLRVAGPLGIFGGDE